MTKGQIDVLRAHGFDDAAVHDIVQVTAMFAY
jgi:alkylhydroperoxidase family enzyme